MNRFARVSFTLAIMSVSVTAQVWTKVTGLKTAGNRISTVKSDPDGGVWVGGSWVDSLGLFDTSVAAIDYSDCYVVKIDTAGRVLRLVKFGGPGFDYLHDLGFTKDGTMVAGGTFQGSMTVGDSNIVVPTADAMYLAEFGNENTPRWLITATAISCKSLSVLDNGDIAVAGQMGDTAVFGKADTLFGRGRQDFFVALYGPDGRLRWARSGGSGDDEFAKKIAAGKDGALYFTGSFRDTVVFNADTLRLASTLLQSFIARLDTTGKTVWMLPVAGDATAIIEELAVDDADNLYVTGYFSGSISIDTINVLANNESEFFLAALTPQGRVRWVQHAEVASGTDIAFGKNNVLFVTGQFKRRTTFGKFVVEAVAVEDLFIGSYSADGTCNWVMTAGGCRSAIGWRIAANEHKIFVAGEVDANRSCSSCPMQFGPIETSYTSEDFGRTFLAVADLTILNRVERPIVPRSARFGAGRGSLRYFDLSGRELHTMPTGNMMYRRSAGFIARQAVVAAGVDGKRVLSLELR